MGNDLMEKALIGGMMAIVMVDVMAQFAQAAAPQPRYTCPICGRKFMTYDELYQHFTTEHPSEPIEIIWE
jgi:hypothetical protein